MNGRRYVIFKNRHCPHSFNHRHHPNNTLTICLLFLHYNNCTDFRTRSTRNIRQNNVGGTASYTNTTYYIRKACGLNGFRKNPIFFENPTRFIYFSSRHSGLTINVVLMKIDVLHFPTPWIMHTFLLTFFLFLFFQSFLFATLALCGFMRKILSQPTK